MNKEQTAKWIKSLETERAGYLRSGKKDRARAVEEQLKSYGWTDPDAPRGRASVEAHKATADQPAKREG